MKQKFSFILILSLLLVSFVSQAQRVLTDEERILLQGSSEFSQKATKAVENYAVFRSTDDGVTGIDGAIGSVTEFHKRAKDKLISVNIVKNGSTDPLIPYRYVQLSKAKQFSGLPAAPAPLEDILTAWTPLIYEEFASPYFDILGESIDFTIVGN